MKPAKLIRQIAKERGLECCYDGACIYGNDGMQTNGGCQALKERDVQTLKRHLQAMRLIAMDLSDRVLSLQVHNAEMAGYCEEKSQLLAWHPVSEGLPTEPGVYEFVNGGINVSIFERDPEGWVVHDTGESVDNGYLTDGHWEYCRRVNLEVIP